jgi:hypothetical protein
MCAVWSILKSKRCPSYHITGDNVNRATKKTTDKQCTKFKVTDWVDRTCYSSAVKAKKWDGPCTEP